MTKALSEAEKFFDRAKKKFVTLSERTTKALTRERDRLLRRIKATNARGKRLALQIKTKTERLSKATTAKTTKTLKQQIAALKKLRAEAREEAKNLRAELAAVRADLASARQHLSRALHADKAMEAFQKQREKVSKRVAKKKKRKKAKKGTAIQPRPLSVP